MLLASLKALRQRDLKSPILAGFITTVTGLLVSLPYYALAFQQTIDYIWTTAFGAQASIWVKHIPLRDSLLYYLTGLVGASSLGSWLYVAPVIWAAAVLVLWLQRDEDALYRAGLVAIIVVLAYLAVTIPTFKGPHGLPFAALFLATTAVASIALIRRLPPVLAWSACTLLLIFSAWQFTWTYTRDHGAANSEFAATRWTLLHEAINAIGNTSDRTLLYETTPLSSVNYSTIAFQDYVEGRVPPIGDLGMLLSDPEAQRQRIAAADVILAVTPEAIDVFPHLPSASKDARAETIKLIEASGRFQPPIRINDTFRGDDFLIYKVRAPFRPFRNEEGLGPVAGPYPQSGLPRIRWGLGAGSAFVAEGSPNAHAILAIEASAQGNVGQTLSILINGQLKQAAPLSAGFVSLNVPFIFDRQGSAKVELRYGRPVPNAVLYKTLTVRYAAP
jgi:hypothetical protein